MWWRTVADRLITSCRVHGMIKLRVPRLFRAAEAAVDPKANRRLCIRRCPPNCCGRNTPCRKYSCPQPPTAGHLDSLPPFSGSQRCILSHSHQRSALCLLSENAENMYYFSALALTLNEPEESVSLTDSRLRPDQRLMEEGRWDEANSEKQRLEEKQRAVRRRREAEASDALDEGMRGEGLKLIGFCLRCVDENV